MTSEERSYLKNKIAELALYCKSRKIPAAFIFAENRVGTKMPETAYDKTIVTPLQCETKLYKDHITPLLVVGHDFKMIPTQYADGFYNFDDDSAPAEMTEDPDAEEPEPAPAPAAKPAKKK